MLAGNDALGKHSEIPVKCGLLRRKSHEIGRLFQRLPAEDLYTTK
jgi:hypothetical protein